MPAWLPRAIALFMLGIAALATASWLLGRLRNLLIILLVSLFLSLAVEPAVNVLARRGWRRGAATGLVFAAIFVFAVVFLYAIGTLLAGQVASLIQTVPHYAQQLIGFVNRHFHTDFSGQQLANQLSRADSGARQAATGLAGRALSLSTSLIGLIFEGFTVLLFTFYMVADGPRLRRAICSLLRPERQRDVLRAWNVAVDKTGGYVYSRALLAAASALVTWIFLTIIGVPYALALGLWMGLVSQFVPTVGTYLAGGLAVLVALLNDPLDAVWTLAFVIAYQQFENYVLAPRITAHTMSMNPAVAFGSVIAGAALLGGIGALLALPAAASIQAFLSSYIHRYEVVEDEALAATPKPSRPGRRRFRFQRGSTPP